MVAALLALLLAAQPASGQESIGQTSTGQTSTRPTPLSGHAPTVTVTAPPPADAAELAKTADEMQQMYQVTCAAREWGSYDDMCDGIRTQVREARAKADKAAREAARSRRAAAAPP